MDAFVTFDKISLLVVDLLTAETWKAKIFPLIKEDVAKLSSIKSYICMYHESSICNLLEVMLYHRTACESSEDALVELIDYCYRKFVAINNKAEYYIKLQNEGMPEKDPKDVLKQSPVDDLVRQGDDIEFACTMIGLSLIRFISDHI